MPRYLSLISFTEQGAKNIKNTIERSNVFRESVKAAGGEVRALYWAMGEFDGCVSFDAPDSDTAAALLFRLTQDGNVRTRTLQLYDVEEFENVLAKV